MRFFSFLKFSRCFVFINFVVDLLYTVIDPRIKIR